MVLLGKIRILQGVGHPISCLGVCYANDPQKGGYTTPAPALDLTTSLRGDFLFQSFLSFYYSACPESWCLCALVNGALCWLSATVRGEGFFAQKGGVRDDALALIGGVFAQRAHSASYYGVYPGNSPENLPPLEACMSNSKVRNSNVSCSQNYPMSKTMQCRQ